MNHEPVQRPLLIATGNAGKLREYKAIFAELPFQILGLADVPPVGEIIEDKPDFLGNATKKALKTSTALRGWSNDVWVLADDSGLVVPFLKGQPGVFSARYAGDNATDAQNVGLLLREMDKTIERAAYFQCALVLASAGEVLGSTEGRCFGKILHKTRGDGGFGYDPVFSPEGESRSMAELTAAEKNAVSHRGAAARRMHILLGEIAKATCEPIP